MSAQTEGFMGVVACTPLHLHYHRKVVKLVIVKGHECSEYVSFKTKEESGEAV